MNTSAKRKTGYAGLGAGLMGVVGAGFQYFGWDASPVIMFGVASLIGSGLSEMRSWIDG